VLCARCNGHFRSWISAGESGMGNFNENKNEKGKFEGGASE
jgi:hypothetical protein